MDISQHIIPAGATVREALGKLNTLSGGNMTLFAVDAEDKLVGSLTDSDIRRALTAGASLDAAVYEVCNRNSLRIVSAQTRFATAAEAKRRGISLIPVVEDGCITDILDFRRLRHLLPIDAVLMAGGRGERLRPMTLTTPKPLLPIGGKPIIDYNVDALIECGVENVFVTVNYLREQLQEHFRLPRRFAGREVSVSCVEEPAPLGTMGSLALVDGLTHDTVLVMNSDLLTNIDFVKMYERHITTDALITVAAVPYTVNIPFAIMEHDGDRVLGLQEKPTYNYLANAGVYMMNRDVVARISKGERLDAPDLISQIIAEGGKVSYFTIDGIWMDIGSPSDFRTADEMMRGKH